MRSFVKAIKPKHGFHRIIVIVITCTFLQSPSFIPTAIANAGSITTDGLVINYDHSSFTSGSSTLSNLVSGKTNATLRGTSTNTLTPTSVGISSSRNYFTTSATEKTSYIYTNTGIPHSDFNNSTSVSAFAWVYPTTDNHVVLEERGSTWDLAPGWYDTQIEMVNKKYKFRVWPCSSISAVAETTQNQWHYVGFTYSGTTMTAYIDGVQVGQITNCVREVPWSYSRLLYYGVGTNAGTHLNTSINYGGFRFGALHVYNRAISSSEVSANSSTKITQTLSFATTSYSKAFGETQTVTATSVGTGAITYSSGASTACTVFGNTVTVTASTGTCTITASRAADDIYQAANSTNSVSITVSKAVQAALTLTSTSAVFLTNLRLLTSGGSGSGAVSYTVSTAGSAGCAVSNGDSLTATTAGTCVVVATKATSTDYFAAYDTRTVTVSKAPLTLTTSVAATLKYGSSSTATYSANRSLGVGAVPNLSGTLVFETSTTNACSINPASGAVTMNRASGTCNIRVSLTNDTNFLDTSSALVSITPAPADALILTADSKTRVFTGSPVVVDPTYSISGLIGSDTVTVTYVYAGVDNAGSGFSLNATTRTNAGTYSIVPSLSMANAESYTAPAIIVNGTLTIDRAARTLSPSSYSKTDLKYRETATVLSNVSSPSSNSDGSFIYTAGSGCAINSSTGEITATSSSGTCSQTTTISRGINYETATAESLTFNLSKADTLTVTTATPAALTFTGSPAVVSPAISVSGLVANETATATFNFSREPSANVSAYGPSITAPTNAGSYVITPSSLTLADPASVDNYVAVTYQTATLTINKASQLPFTNYSTLSGIFGSNFIVYKFGGSGDGEETFTVTNGTATGCTLNGTVLTVTTAGSCLITATKLTSENYLQAESTFTVIIYVFVAAPTAPVSTTPTQIAIATSNAWSTSATAKPKISGISPSSGPVGTEVTITGTGFDGVDTVRIGLENLTNITGLTSTSVTGTIPVGASSGPIFVSNSLGGGVLFSGFTVTSGP